MAYVVPPDLASGYEIAEANWDTHIRANMIDHETRIVALEGNERNYIQLNLTSVATGTNYAVPTKLDFTTATEIGVGDFRSGTTGTNILDLPADYDEVWRCYGWLEVYRSTGTGSFGIDFAPTPVGYLGGGFTYEVIGLGNDGASGIKGSESSFASRTYKNVTDATSPAQYVNVDRMIELKPGGVAPTIGFGAYLSGTVYVTDAKLFLVNVGGGVQ